MKKLLALLLAALMVVTLCACSSEDSSKDDLGKYLDEEVVVDRITIKNGDYVDTFHFDFDDSETVTITKFVGTDTPHDVVIPDVIYVNGVTGKVVTAAEYESSNIDDPEDWSKKTVTAVGEQAFYFCSNVKSVTIPGTVISIGAFAFAGCASIEVLNIPASVTKIGESAFATCTGIKTVQFAAESGVKDIQEKTFFGCTALTEITIPGYVQTVGTGAFYGCTALTDVMISEGVVLIGAQAFQNCEKMAKISLPASVSSIGEFAFSGSEDLYRDGITCPADSYAEKYIEKNLILDDSAPETDSAE